MEKFDLTKTIEWEYYLLTRNFYSLIDSMIRQNESHNVVRKKLKNQISRMNKRIKDDYPYVSIKFSFSGWYEFLLMKKEENLDFFPDLNLKEVKVMNPLFINKKCDLEIPERLNRCIVN